MFTIFTYYPNYTIPQDYLLISVTLYLIITISIFTLLKKFFNQTYSKPNYEKTKTKFQYLLQSPNNFNFDSKYLDLVTFECSPLIKCLDDFCKTNNIYDKKGIIVSLSGGVDSMVTLAILIFLNKKYNISIYTASIDYGLREESNDESEFLKEYTKTLGIEKSYVSYVSGVSRKKENSGSRSEFEEESRNLRFNTYKKIIEENGLDKDTGVFVAHHQDDIVENIFTNSMKGANLLDLEVIKSINIINGVKILRPFIGFKKQVIYDFAHKFNVPFFLDTTPSWSKRGKMRNEIFPLLDSVFGVDWRNKLKQLGTHSNEWGNYIDKYVIKPWLDEVSKSQAGIIIPLKDQPMLIYTTVIMKSLHSIGQTMLKKTSIEKINNLIANKQDKAITLDGTRICTLIESKTKLLIIDTSLVVESLDRDVKEVSSIYDNIKLIKIIQGTFHKDMKINNGVLNFLNNKNNTNQTGNMNKQTNQSKQSQQTTS
jgi:tRNA(Ile)-lysidine synthetase-like protein